MGSVNLHIKKTKHGLVIWLSRAEAKDEKIKDYITELKKNELVHVFLSGTEPLKAAVEKILSNS